MWWRRLVLSLDWRLDLLTELSEPGSGCEADLRDEIGGGQVWRHARPVGIGHAPLFQPKKFCPVVSGNEVSRKIASLFVFV